MALTSPLTRSQQIAQQDTALVHSILSNMQKRVQGGIPAVPARAAVGNIPAQDALPAITAEQYQQDLGADLSIFQALFAAALP